MRRHAFFQLYHIGTDGGFARVLFIVLITVTVLAAHADEQAGDRMIADALRANDLAAKGDFAGAQVIWEKLAADPDCPATKHMRHLAASAQIQPIAPADGIEIQTGSVHKSSIINSLKSLAADASYCWKENARDELLSFLEQEGDWAILLSEIPSDTKNQRHLLLKSKALLHTGHPQEAENLIRKIWLNPGELPLTAESDKLYQRVLETRKKTYPGVSMEDLFQRARALDRLGDRNGAAELYRTVIDSKVSEPVRTDAKLFLAKILSDTFQNADALAMYNEFLDYHPNHVSEATILFRKSILHRRTGDDEAYLAMVETVNRRHRSSKWRESMLIGRGDYWRSVREWDSAESDFLDVIRTGRSQRDFAWWKYAWTAYNRDDYREASARLDKMKSEFGGEGWKPAIRFWQQQFSDLANPPGLDNAFYRSLAREYPWDYYGQRSAAIAGLEIAGPIPGPVPAMTPSEKARLKAAVFLEAAGLLERAAAEYKQVSEKEQKVSDGLLYRMAACLVRSGDVPAARRLIIRRFDKTISKGKVPAVFARILYPVPDTLKPFYQEVCRNTGLDPLLAVAVTLQESGFDRKALSHNLAGGLMQVMPELFKRFAAKWPDNPGIEEYQRPEYNIRAGVEYLAWLLDRYGGSIPKALAGYNAGEHRVDVWIKEYPYPDDVWVEHIPFQQTRLFVKKIMENHGCYRIIHPDAFETQVPAGGSETDEQATDLTGREISGI